MFALSLHLALLFNFKNEDLATYNSSETTKSDLIIGLKKLRPARENVIPQTLTQSIKPKELKPVRIKSEQTPVIAKPIPKTKPVKSKQAQISKPRVIAPQPALTENQLKQSSSPTTSHNSATIEETRNEVTSSNAPEHASKQDKQVFLNQLSQWLERHKRYPAIARRRGQQGQVVIQFTVDRHGQLTRYEFIQRSQYPSLNAATVRMLKNASPMPTPPSSILGSKSELTYTIPVNFNLTK